MTSRRIDTAAAFAATLLVLPAVVLLASAMIRLMQPVQYQPAHAADVIFTWFVSITAGLLVLGYDIVKAQQYGWTSARTIGATCVPNSSIERSTSWWVTAPTLIWAM